MSCHGIELSTVSFRTATEARGARWHVRTSNDLRHHSRDNGIRALQSIPKCCHDSARIGPRQPLTGSTIACCIDHVRIAADPTIARRSPAFNVVVLLHTALGQETTCSGTGVEPAKARLSIWCSTLEHPMSMSPSLDSMSGTHQPTCRSKGQVHRWPATSWSKKYSLNPLPLQPFANAD